MRLASSSPARSLYTKPVLTQRAGTHAYPAGLPNTQRQSIVRCREKSKVHQSSTSVSTYAGGGRSRTDNIRAGVQDTDGMKTHGVIITGAGTTVWYAVPISPARDWIPSYRNAVP